MAEQRTNIRLKDCKLMHFYKADETNYSFLRIKKKNKITRKDHFEETYSLPYNSLTF